MAHRGRGSHSLSTIFPRALLQDFMAKSCPASSPLYASPIMCPIFQQCRHLVERVWRLWIYLLLGCIFQASTLAMNPDRKSTRLNSSHSQISYAVFCLKKK